MAIRVRQGNEKDFDPYKLLPGEWAVSLDKKYVYMCFSAGEVRRMATYEAFEEDMVQIEKILAVCENIQVAVEAFGKLAERHAAQAETYSVESESWAVGGTGTREEENTNNSKYYSQQSETQANRAKNEADRAASIANIDIATTEKAGIIKGNAEEFSISADGKLSLTSSYEEQETLEEIDGTEDKKTLFGKIAGAVRELIAHTGSKSIHYTLTNNLLANVAGTALDAVQGKALDDRITGLNNSLKIAVQSVDSIYLPFSIRRYGNMAEVSFSRNKADLTANVSYVVGHVPAGFRPYTPVTLMLPAGRNGGVAYFSITTAGEMGIRTYTDIAANDYMYGRITYIRNPDT